MFILANLRIAWRFWLRKRQARAEKPRGDWDQIGRSVVCTAGFLRKEEGTLDTSVIHWLMKYL